MPPMGETISAPTRFERSAAIAVLTVFGLTWPVLELLGENAEFFLARRSSRWEILGLALVLMVVIPVGFSLLGAMPGRAGEIVAGALILVLAVATIHYFLSRLDIAWWLALAGGVAIGSALTWAFYRFPAGRSASRYLLASPLVFLMVFLFSTPSGEIVLDSNGTPGSPATVGNPAPVVMLVFDEFPVASLMTSDGTLRAEQYPNFARLADDGIWYRNAVTVEQQTEHSIPAMLTGVIPDQSLTPYAGQYPNSLFTALQDSHELDIYEAITRLCPTTICEGLEPSSTPLAQDVMVVAGHVLLPDPLTEDLPPIDGSWGDFAATTTEFDAITEFLAELEKGPEAPFEELIADIGSYDGEKPPFFFLHALTPHHPWEFLPDGRSYPLVVNNPATNAGGWIDDDFLVAQGMQRHLLQVGYADHLLGDVIGALEDAGLYQDAVVVVVADHGIAVKPGVEHQRTITDDTIGDIAAVPLFIKAPGHAGGQIDDRRALTIDLVPTIADVLEADLAWEPDGASLLGPMPERSETTTVGPSGSVTYGVDGAEKLEVASRIERWFPQGDPYILLPPGSTDMIGEPIDTAALAEAEFRAGIRRASFYNEIDLTSGVVPAQVGGDLSGNATGSEILAVVVNGRVAAVTRSYLKEERMGYSAMVDPAFFGDGANSIEIVLVSPDGGLLLVPRP